MAFIYDTFTGANGIRLDARAGESGVTWSQHPGFASSAAAFWAIQNNRAAAVNGAGSSVIAAPEMPADDFDISVPWHVASTAAYPAVGWFVNPVESTGYIFRRASNTGNWEIWRWTGGTETLLASAPAPVTVGTTYAVKVEVRGSTFMAFVNGALVCTATDTINPRTGRIALMNFGAAGSTTSSHFDSISVDLVPSYVIVLPVIGTDDTAPVVDIP